jgi:hypothetical protein
MPVSRLESTAMRANPSRSVASQSRSVEGHVAGGRGVFGEQSALGVAEVLERLTGRVVCVPRVGLDVSHRACSFCREGRAAPWYR